MGYNYLCHKGEIQNQPDLLGQGIRYWLWLVILFYNLFFCFWDTVNYVTKIKYQSNKICVIKARYTLMVATRL